VSLFNEEELSMRVYALAVMLAAGLGTAGVAAQSAGDTAAALAVVDGFHAAVSGGKPEAAMQLLAEDAIMLEAGGVETRSEYEKNHLPADTEFEKGVTTKRSPIRVVVQGDTAWAVSTSEVTGTFQGRPVDFMGAESMVLTRGPAGWRIRAIHWSSRARRPAQ
jgi:ketosteroid isomerase-like protein